MHCMTNELKPDQSAAVFVRIRYIHFKGIFTHNSSARPQVRRAQFERIQVPL